jgi:outer membrane protein OmpA-like peptidoglycan-associated protein
VNDNIEQMKLKAFKILTIASIAVTGTLMSCKADSNSPGLEYMPDMYRSPAVEAYVDYGEVEGRYDAEAQAMVEEKFSYLPPIGTIPYSGSSFTTPYSHGAPVDVGLTHGLFEARVDADGLEDARADINPVPYTQANADEGLVLYERFCIHCHGEKGDGQGTVVTNSNGKFATPGAYKKEMPAGEMFYYITYGKGRMGSHASQVNAEERWQIIHHVEKLAGKDKVVEAPLLFDAHTDTDGDGVMDNKDDIPTVPGDASNHGSPIMSPETQAVTDFADGNVMFELGSATIAPASYGALDRLATLMTTDSTLNMVINGHTDNTGNSTLNKVVSLNRAQAAKAYLTEKGIDKSRISAIGYGQNKPKATNSTEEGRLANRRVEFRMFK